MKKTIEMNDKYKEFWLRTMSACILFPPVLYSVYVGGLLYFILLFIVIILCGYEWNNICGKWSFGIDSMVFITVIILSMTCFYLSEIILGTFIIFVGSYITYIVAKLRKDSSPNIITIPAHLNRPKWFFIGNVYLGIGFSSMAFLINLDDYGVTLIWVFTVTVASDVFAYIFGSILKGKKILPKVSPGKSWSGFIAATIMTALVTYFFGLYTNVSDSLTLLVIGAFVAFFAHLGDMLESGFKRYLGIKDTSNLIPGHGGILDRIDAIIMVAIYVMVISIILDNSPLYM